MKTPPIRIRLKTGLALLAAGAFMAILTLGSGPGASGSGALTVDKMYARPLAGCQSPGVDDGAYSLIGTKIPAGGMTFRTNPTTFPAALSTLGILAAINSSFATWDSATPQALFVNGGITAARPGANDGINTIGFGNVTNNAVAVTYGWYDRKTSLLTEFDTILSSRYTWAVNAFASGDCGGAPGAFDIRDITTHEAGHIAGLADITQSAGNAQTEFEYVTTGELFKRDLASGDLKGVAVLYGP